MISNFGRIPFALLFSAALLAGPAREAPGGWTLIGWNDLGMHCMDGDYTVFSILPPFNTIHAHLIDASGKLTRSGSGVTVTYEAVADADGSINTTSTWKTQFWRFVQTLFGAAVAPDMGLAGNAMPGRENRPQPMRFDAARNTFSAEGIPITAWDDAGNKNYYPMMRLTARDASGNVVATTDIVLPVSDEMDCRACHASGVRRETQPRAGWSNDPLAERDYKLNILLLHDERRGASATFAGALGALGYKSGGLHATAISGAPVLCGSCHSTNALGTKGQPGVPALTGAVHSRHARVTDPVTGVALDADENRSTCYRCHPGSETRCLRGAMGAAVAANGSPAIECQSCHGSMSAVGGARTGWLDEPDCQSCHTGTAVRNSGQIRFASVFQSPGVVRQAADSRFATNPNTPAQGFSLYRFSTGHGGLQCEACHGSTHAEYPSSHASDNAQSIRLQGGPGALADCAACHRSPSTINGGPHGMHAVGDAWVREHEEYAEHGTAPCQECHGVDYSGTVLSRALGARTLNTEFGTKQLWRGFQVGCYLCHDGPRTERRSTNHAPVVFDLKASAAAGGASTVALMAVDPNSDPMTIRIVSQPRNGTAALEGSTATYRPYAGFEGADSFTYAAWDGKSDSNLAIVNVTVEAASRPALTAEGIVNVASYERGAVAPGEMIAIFGTRMGPETLAGLQLNSAGLVARSLAGTRVLFDGMPAPLVFTSSEVIAAIVPFGVAAGQTTHVQVEYQGIRSAPVVVEVGGSAPGIFSRDASGRGQGAFINSDGVTLNSPANPAPPGAIVSLYATGQGLLDAPLIDGELPGVAPPLVKLPVSVQVGGLEAAVTFRGAAPYSAGLVLVNFRIPAGVAPADDVPVTLKIGDRTSRAGITMAVR